MRFSYLSTEMINQSNHQRYIMRDATKEEIKFVNKYIESISIETDLNFWDLAMDKALTAEQLIEISKKRGHKEPYELGYEVKDKNPYRQIKVK